MAKSDKLFVTEGECAERIGIATDEFRAIATVLESSGLPSQDPLFKNRRYWPAVKAWLDRRYSLTTGSGPYAVDEVEPWKKTPPGIDGKENWD